MGVQIFVIVTKLNGNFCKCNKNNSIICTYHDHNGDTNNVPWQVREDDVKEIGKDLGDNFAPVLRSSKKKGENLMSWWDK